MAIERPTSLKSAAEMQREEALRELMKPKHCEFSRYFPRIRGTPQKYKGPALKRARSKGYEDTMQGMRNFIEFADKASASAKIELNSVNFKPWMHRLFNTFCDLTGIRGTEKRQMRAFLDTELEKLKQEYIEWEKDNPIKTTKPEFKSTGGFERNKPCWCGSKKKYKRCHIGALPS